MGCEEPAAFEAAVAPRGDLASRLREKGLVFGVGAASAAPLGHRAAAPLGGDGLSSSLFAPSTFKSSSSSAVAASKAAVTSCSAQRAAASAPVVAHAPLTVSVSEKRSIFTPLVQQGAKAIEAENKRKTKGEKDLLDGVRYTLCRWVQECLARDEKREKLLAKGVLKCRVQAKWSEGLHERLLALIKGYGGRLSADCDKENGAAAGKPAWLPRNERWLVSFDAAAFENFARLHPEVVEAPILKVRAFVENYVRGVNIEAVKIKQLFEELEGKFGPMRKALLDRCKRMAADAINESSGKKRKTSSSSSAPVKKAKTGEDGSGVAVVVPDDVVCARIETAEDVAWAASILAPLGLRAEGGDPLVRPPAFLLVPVLRGLSSLEHMEGFRDLLRSAQIGKVVNVYRRHPNAEVAKLSKELVASWKAACGLAGGPPAAAAP